MSSQILCYLSPKAQVQQPIVTCKTGDQCPDPVARIAQTVNDERCQEENDNCLDSEADPVAEDVSDKDAKHR